MRKVASATACSDCWIIAASPETAHQEVLAQNAHDQLYQATPDVYLSPQQLAIQNIDTFS